MAHMNRHSPQQRHHNPYDYGPPDMNDMPRANPSPMHGYPHNYMHSPPHRLNNNNNNLMPPNNNNNNNNNNNSNHHQSNQMYKNYHDNNNYSNNHDIKPTKLNFKQKPKGLKQMYNDSNYYNNNNNKIMTNIKNKKNKNNHNNNNNNNYNNNNNDDIQIQINQNNNKNKNYNNNNHNNTNNNHPNINKITVKIDKNTNNNNNNNNINNNNNNNNNNNSSNIQQFKNNSNNYSNNLSYNNNNNTKKSKKPNISELDKFFLNEDGFKRYQKWERFNEAQLWLPGERTSFKYKEYRYIFGEPINIGINGHIYYCYRWKLKNNNNNNNNNNENIPKIETLGVKIVPNREDYSREFKIIKKLQLLNNKNIINLLDIIKSTKILCGIMELAKMDAHQFFVRNGLKRFKLTEKTFINNKINKKWINLRKAGIREYFAKQIMYDIINALYDIQKNKYIHFDIKIRNILIFFPNNLYQFELTNWKIKSKLCDFGHSYYGEYKLSSITDNGNVNLGTHGHIAPELFVKNKKCNYKVDIWSLGITLLMILCPGYYIFDKYTTLNELKEKYYNINHKNINKRLTIIPPWWSEFQTLSPESRDLILYLTRYEPKNRPNYSQILNHPWFKPKTINHLPFYKEYCSNAIYSMVPQE